MTAVVARDSSPVIPAGTFAPAGTLEGDVDMMWILKDTSARRPADLPEHIERRLRFALVRFGRRIEKVFVFLHDSNGPRGGVDKVCRILVKTRGCGAVVVTETDAQWVAAVDRATTRIGHSVARHIDRTRQRRGVSARMPGAPDREALPA